MFGVMTGLVSEPDRLSDVSETESVSELLADSGSVMIHCRCTVTVREGLVSETSTTLTLK